VGGGEKKKSFRMSGKERNFGGGGRLSARRGNKTNSRGGGFPLVKGKKKGGKQVL